MKRNCFRKNVLAGMLAFACFLVKAQETPMDTTKVLEEVVVSVNRWEQNLNEVPDRVAKVSADLIKFQNPQTAADLLGISNQVFIQKSQMGGGSPMIRGFSTNRVLLVVDGVRMNNAIFRSGNLQNVILLDANAIENAEVVFGPGSVIYGSDAIGGVMDFHTLSPRLSITEKPRVAANALFRTSSANNEKTGHVDFNIGFKKLAFLTSVTYSDYDDLEMGFNGPEEYTRPDYVVRENGVDIVKVNPHKNEQVPTAYNQLNLMQKIRFRPSADWDIKYGFQYSESSDVPRYDRLILKNDDDSFVNAEWYYGPQKWMMHNLSVAFVKPTIFSDQAKLTLAYQEYEESRHNRSFGSNRKTNRTEKVEAFSINFDLDKAFNQKFTLFYGGEFVTNTVGSTAYHQNVNDGSISATTTRYPNNSKWRTGALYGNVKYKLNSKWILNGSARFTNVYTYAEYDTDMFPFPFSEAKLNNNAVNGSLGAVFNPTSQIKTYANVSTGFRAPNVDDIGKVFDSEPGNVVVPNPDLEPEYGYNAELGAAFKFGSSIDFDFAVYYSYLDNAIARGVSTFNGMDSIDYDGELSRVLSLQNISSMNVYGLQMQFKWKLTKDFLFTTAYNYQKGKEKDAETGRDYSPTHVAPGFGSTHLIYSFMEKFKADFYTNYNGEISYENLALSERDDAHLYAKDKNGNPYAPSWWTMNLKLSYSFKKYVVIDGGVENIFDIRYRPYSSGISAPGRNFILSVRVSI